METLRGLSKVRVNKEFLLGKLTINKVEHEKSYYEILEVRQKNLIEKLQEELEKARADTTLMFEPVIYAPLPENHTKDYERVISMLDASLDEEFELTSTEFNQYVNDDWQWKAGFMTISGCYLPQKEKEWN